MLKFKQQISCIGYASGIASRDPSSCMGPLVLQEALARKRLPLIFEWVDMLYPHQAEKGLEVLPAIVEINQRLARHVCELTTHKKPFLVIGGDHTSAIGTWSGAAHALRSHGNLGLIWIDAHLDSHTFKTTHSGNLHGMPLAVLLGHGEDALIHLMDTKSKLHPSHLCLIGVRSFEKEELKLLNHLKVKIFFMTEVMERGIDVIMQEAIQIVNKHTVGYGVSLDIDAIDPEDAPGTDAKEPNGIRGKALLESFKYLQNDPRLLGFEIAEFFPSLDKEQRTERLIEKFIKKIYTFKEK